MISHMSSAVCHIALGFRLCSIGGLTAAPPEPVVETGRVLAAVEPVPTATTEQVDEAWGPDPVPSELDGLKGYEPESPEELGASPLPGFDVTPPPPSAAG